MFVDLLVSSMDGVRISEEEEEPFNVAALVEAAPRRVFTLGAKVLAPHIAHLEHLQTALSAAWRREFSFIVLQGTSVTRDNLFMFEFEQ